MTEGPLVALIVGARPNFMKAGPVLRALRAHGVRCELVHTGQHYDEKMSAVFFQDLELPEPDTYLGVGSGSHAEQTAAILVAFEKYCLEHEPSWVVVVGDVNSTVACALVATKLHIRVAHVEAGLRSFDRRMPEEINRLLTDQIADLLLTPSPDGDENLAREGVAPDKVVRIGNVMIDTLQTLLPKAKAAGTLERLGLEPQGYTLLTLHRPSNVDDREVLTGILDALEKVAARSRIVFPVHPRTQRRLEEFSLADRLAGIEGMRVVEPLGYLDFLCLSASARLVLTDSGGLQEETAVLGVPCLTLRENTERPITVTEGTNRIVGSDPNAIVEAALAALDAPMPGPHAPDLWDGHAGERAAAALISRL